MSAWVNVDAYFACICRQVDLGYAYECDNLFFSMLQDHDEDLWSRVEDKYRSMCKLPIGSEDSLKWKYEDNILRIYGGLRDRDYEYIPEILNHFKDITEKNKIEHGFVILEYMDSKGDYIVTTLSVSDILNNNHNFVN